MYLTEEEMNYIFDSSTEKAGTSPLLVRVLGKTPEEIKRGGEIYKGIDDRLKQEFGLPLPTKSASLLLNPSHKSELPLRALSYSAQVIQKTGCIDRKTAFLCLIDNNILLFKDFLIKHGISQHNIDNLTFKEFSTKCKLTFGPKAVVTPEMFNKFKNVVKTNPLANDLSLMTYAIACRNNPATLRTNITTATLSQEASVNNILSDIVSNDKTNNLHLLDLLPSNCAPLKPDIYESDRKSDAKFNLLYGMIIFAPSVALGRLVASFCIAETYALRAKMPTMFFARKAFDDACLSLDLSQKEAERIVTQKNNEIRATRIETIINITKDKDIDISIPENKTEKVEQHFKCFDDMIEFLTTATSSNTIFVDIDNLTVYISPEISAFDTIDEATHPEEKQNEEVEIPNLTDHNQDDPLL